MTTETVNPQSLVKHLHATARAIPVACGHRGVMYRIVTNHGQLSGIYRSEHNAWEEAFRSLRLSTKELRFLEKRVAQKGLPNA